MKENPLFTIIEGEGRLTIESGHAWEMRLGPCTAALASLEDKSIDHVISDPPYDARTHKKGSIMSMKGGGTAIVVDFDALTDMRFVGECLRVSKRWNLFFCSLLQFVEYEKEAPKCWIRAGIWDRQNGAPQLSGDRPAQSADGIAILHSKGRKVWNGGGKRAMWRSPVEHIDREHPTQKPVQLMMDLIEDFTDPGDLILDPFSGSATTGVAALRLGRRFLGFELDSKYFALACERLRAEEAHVSLSSSRSSQLPLFGITADPTY